MFSTFKQIFFQIRYITIAVTISAMVFAFAVWLPNIRLIGQIIFNSSASVTDKVSFLFSLFGSIQTNFSLVSASYTIAIAALFGINVALLVYYVRCRRNALSRSGATLSISGLVSGVFGIGCAACGTFVLTPVLALFGASGLLTILPFGGEEFGFLGVILLVYSVYITLKRIEQPIVCSIE